jgi:hypothetical protein
MLVGELTQKYICVGRFQKLNNGEPEELELSFLM